MTAETFSLSLPAHAKLNLRLHIGPSNGGALHTILSFITPLELADELVFSHSQDGFCVRCDDPSIPVDANLALRAARALDVSLPAVCIKVHKRIPLQAGLGGGSADAAATLRGLAHVFRTLGASISSERLQRAAKKVGSDVPSCLARGMKIVSGWGDQVRRLRVTPPPWGIVLLKPQLGVPTSDAYRLLDAARAAAGLRCRGYPGSAEVELTKQACDAVRTSNFPRFCALLHNDFQTFVEAAYPSVRVARRKLAVSGALASVLCGSGSCVAGFFETMAAAESCRAALAVQPGEWKALTRMISDG
jgi:4-diphosphocytidyl-2-C-methyl-D-erythritol kinase